MKILRILFFSVLASFAATAQNTDLGERTKADFEQMSFIVDFDKNNYFLSEPIIVKFKFSNQTANPITTYQPVFLQESELKVDFNGKVRTFRSLSNITGIPMRFPGSFAANTSITDHEILGPSFTGQFFPVPGNYKVHFVLQSSDGKKTIESNTLDIVVNEPTGIDEGAFEFMKRNEKYFSSSSWVFHEKEGLELLETFVRLYEKSVYGEFGISNLAYVYLGSNKLEQAKNEFEKIKLSKNSIVRTDA